MKSLDGLSFFPCDLLVSNTSEVPQTLFHVSDPYTRDTTVVITPLLLWWKSTQKHVTHILGCRSAWKSAPKVVCCLLQSAWSS